MCIVLKEQLFMSRAAGIRLRTPPGWMALLPGLLECGCLSCPLVYIYNMFLVQEAASKAQPLAHWGLELYALDFFETLVPNNFSAPARQQ